MKVAKYDKDKNLSISGELIEVEATTDRTEDTDADWDDYFAREHTEADTDDLVLAQTEVIEAVTTTGSHTWTVPDGVEKVDVLVVAGGGSAGGDDENRGGGGAGGLIFYPSYSVTGGEDITVVVGDGGAEQTNGGAGNDGEDSSFGDLTAKGGGGGAGWEMDGIAGGSGGGAAGRENNDGGDGIQPTQAGDSGTYGHGNRGGHSHSADGSNRVQAGGGGAGEPAEDPPNEDETAGDGGDGLKEVTINETTYNFAELFGTDYGEIIDSEVWFAGGGAGNDTNDSAVSGKGGGGDSWQAGTDNTGGGGSASETEGQPGGSGIVLIRYDSNEGIRTSPPLSLDNIKDVISSEITWTSTEPTDTNITIECAVNADSTTEPSDLDYAEATSGQAIPGISEGDDLTGKYLWVRQKLETTDPDSTPQLSSLYVEVNQEAKFFHTSSGDLYTSELIEGDKTAITKQKEIHLEGEFEEEVNL